MGQTSLLRRAHLALMPRLTRLLTRLGLREPVRAARARFARALRHRAEARGSDRRSRPALHDMERKLDDAIGRAGGFYVEAGANDGFTQSNTYWLERFRGWRGILVEPMPTLVAECRAERPAATVVHAALVPIGHDGETIRMQFGDLMSTVRDGRDDAAEHSAPGLLLGWRDAYEADVPARTLSSILDDAGAPEVDLLSLDVEGFEPQALRGLDLDRHAPRWIVVEALDAEKDRAAIEAVIGERYALHSQITPLDLLYRRTDIPAAAQEDERRGTSSVSSSGSARETTSNTP